MSKSSETPDVIQPSVDSTDEAITTTPKLVRLPAERETDMPVTPRLHVEPAPEPCPPWCSLPAHGGGDWEHARTYLGQENNEVRIDLTHECRHSFGTIHWTDDEPAPERPNAEVILRRFQFLDFQADGTSRVGIQPANIDVHILTDTPLTSSAARELARLLIEAADSAEVTQ